MEKSTPKRPMDESNSLLSRNNYRSSLKISMNIIIVVCLMLTLFANSKLFAQCTNCISNKQFTPDFCYSSDEFPNLCAQFKVDRSHYILLNKKKEKPITENTNDSLQYYIKLASDKSLKLSAIEILFIQEANKVWKKEKRDIGLAFTESGLGYKITDQGQGDLPKAGQKVIVHYTGTLESGEKFDSSIDRNQPFVFTLGAGQVIKGWDEGIALLNIGSKALLKVPANLGYGSRGAGGIIPPNATLYFEVELLGIE